MVALSPPPSTEFQWSTLSFASTLYLQPILDVLLTDIPRQWQAELRLGLQEALVNASKHGNCLDPCKTVRVRFAMIGDYYWWIISDQGLGFQHPCDYRDLKRVEDCPQEAGECGRGLYIMHQIFDQVRWVRRGTELQLCKQMRRHVRLPLVR